MSKKLKRGKGIIAQIGEAKKYNPAPADTAITVDALKEMMTCLEKIKPDAERQQEWLKEYGHLIGKSRAELESIVKDGAYPLPGMVGYTGKYGFIRILEIMNEPLQLP